MWVGVFNRFPTDTGLLLTWETMLLRYLASAPVMAPWRGSHCLLFGAVPVPAVRVPVVCRFVARWLRGPRVDVSRSRRGAVVGASGVAGAWHGCAVWSRWRWGVRGHGARAWCGAVGVSAASTREARGGVWSAARFFEPLDGVVSRSCVVAAAWRAAALFAVRGLFVARHWGELRGHLGGAVWFLAAAIVVSAEGCGLRWRGVRRRLPRYAWVWGVVTVCTRCASWGRWARLRWLAAGRGAWRAGRCAVLCLVPRLTWGRRGVVHRWSPVGFVSSAGEGCGCMLPRHRRWRAVRGGVAGPRHVVWSCVLVGVQCAASSSMAGAVGVGPGAASAGRVASCVRVGVPCRSAVQCRARCVWGRPRVVASQAWWPAAAVLLGARCVALTGHVCRGGACLSWFPPGFGLRRGIWGLIAVGLVCLGLCSALCRAT